jgi:aminopeptidase N
MTTLYSIYYEFSKRYPHSRITGMKQETICSKTQLVLRMLNYTLGEETFKKGLQAFFVDRDHKTFLAEDIWSAMTKQAHADKKLNSDETVSAITESWIKKERLPVVTVTRDYQKNEATIDQKLYLRERPHDVPEADKMQWWIPVTLTSESDLNFEKFTPRAWMKREKQIKIQNLPAKDKFVIVNAEEIGPFPVNYDDANWNMIGE